MHQAIDQFFRHTVDPERWRLKGYMYMAGPMTSYYRESHAKVIRAAWDASYIEGEMLRLGWCVINPYSSVHCARNFAPNEHALWAKRGQAMIEMIAAYTGCDKPPEYRRCRGAILLAPGYENSPGTIVDELPYAEGRGLELCEWHWLDPFDVEYRDYTLVWLKPSQDEED